MPSKEKRELMTARKTAYAILIVIVLVLLNASPALTDDVGITKARLIQKSEKSTLL